MPINLIRFKINEIVFLQLSLNSPIINTHTHKNKNEILVFGIFERMIEDINKINLNFKTNAKNHIEGFQTICKIEKEKSLNTETELFENEIKLLNTNGN